MAKLGMDDVAVRSLAGQLDGHAKAISALVGQIEGVVSRMHSTWKGHDSDEFVGWWHNQHKPALQRAHDSIAGLAQSARNNAFDQDAASGMSTGGTAPAAHPPAPSQEAPAPTPPVGTHPAAPPPTLGAYEAGIQLHATSAGWATGSPANGRADQYGDAAYNCTSWAAFRRQQLGLSVPHGNGWEMASSVGAATDHSQIAQGSVVSTELGQNHVMIVESVDGPGRYTISEMNIDNRGGFSANSTLVQNADGSWTDFVNGIKWTTFPPNSLTFSRV